MWKLYESSGDLYNKRMTRFAHLSDIHLTSPSWEWRLEDWFNKRFAAWFNFRCLGRGNRFSQADVVLEAIRRELDERPPDHVIFSGDATALGFESEIKKAAEKIGVGLRPGIAVPGNHDYCTPPAERSGNFERYFAPWQDGVRVDDHHYPFAQKVGPVWLIAVNSCTGNFWPWDAGGAVGAPQRERLAQLLKQLGDAPRLLVTHYPVCLSNGKPEPRVRGMRDIADVLKVVGDGRIHLWLHGHRHHSFYHLKTPVAEFPVICAGSSTQNQLWSYFEYETDGKVLKANRRGFDAETGRFRDVEAFEIPLTSIKTPG